jgi:hypothetical protein
MGLGLVIVLETSSSKTTVKGLTTSKTYSIGDQTIASSSSLSVNDYNSEISSYTPINPPPLLTEEDTGNPLISTLKDPEFWKSLVIGQIDPPRVIAFTKWIIKGINNLNENFKTKFSTSRMVVDRINRNALQTFIHRLGMRPVTQALTKAVMSTGKTMVNAVEIAFSPSAWFAFEVVSGTLDQMLGAYTDVQDKDYFEKMRDYFLRYTQDHIIQKGEKWPIPAGPYEIEQKDFDDLLLMARNEYENIYKTNSAIRDELFRNYDRIYNQRGLTDEQQLTLVSEYQDSLLLTTALEKIAQKYNGKVINMHDRLWITFRSKQDTDAYQNSEMEEYYFPMWVDDQGGYAYRAPSIIKTFCESLGYNTVINKLEYLCRVGDGYCESNGTDPDGASGFCRLPRGQQVAEDILGTTVVRGLKQVFDPDQYGECPDGSHSISDYTCQSDSGLLKSYFRGVVPKEVGPCPSGTTNNGAGMCVSCNNPRLPYLKNGICYKDGGAWPGYTVLPTDYSCPPDGYPDFTRQSGLFCYHRDTQLNPGIQGYQTVNITVPVKYSCPSNTRTCPVGLVDSAACYPITSPPDGAYCCISGGPRTFECLGNPQVEKPKVTSCPTGYEKTLPTDLLCQATAHKTKKTCPSDLVLDRLGDTCVGSEPATSIPKPLRCPTSHPADIGNGSCYAPCRTGLVEQRDNPIMCVDENHRGTFTKPRRAQYAQPDRERSPFGKMEADYKNCTNDTCRAKAATYMTFAIFPLITGNGLGDLVNLAYDTDVYLTSRPADEDDQT